jgi:ClpP class serine protease
VVSEENNLRPVYDDASAPAAQPSAAPAPQLPDLSNVSELIKLVRTGKDEDLKAAIAVHLDGLAQGHGVEPYLVLYLFDPETSINSYHSNEIYEAASAGERKRDILLIVQSPGGSIEPAYLISKTCKRLAADRFVVAVPRRAKSAATLIALGADEIHMGLMSELGPIDPQIGGYPALGLMNALNKVSELSAKYPRSAEMWSKYLGAKLDLNNLGYFDRVSESAAQYAERLMRGRALPEGKTAASLASHFVNHYKDHSFVIDYDESVGLLGQQIVKTNTVEYNFANAVYGFLNFFELLLGALKKKDFAIIGTSRDLNMRDKEAK